jgi:AcrR family transcriptional regulator
MRADAQRNYDRLVHEAKQAFLVHGTDVALEDIARHAGVGIGTLYRHFPDRYALLSAVYELELDTLSARAEELMTADDPADALVRWLRSVAVHSTAYRGLAAAVMEGAEERMVACKTRLRGSGGQLLLRAQQAGAVRADATISDLLKLTYALVSTAEKNPDERGLFDRLMSLALLGVLTRDAPAPARSAPAPARPAAPAAPGASMASAAPGASMASAAPGASVAAEAAGVSGGGCPPAAE